MILKVMSVLMTPMNSYEDKRADHSELVEEINIYYIFLT